MLWGALRRHYMLSQVQSQCDAGQIQHKWEHVSSMLTQHRWRHTWEGYKANAKKVKYNEVWNEINNTKLQENLNVSVIDNMFCHQNIARFEYE